MWDVCGFFFFFSSRRRHTRCLSDWSSDVCSSDLYKDEYAKKSPADQTALSQKLLQKGIETNDDLPSKFVLLKEARDVAAGARSEEHTSELQSLRHIVCRLLLEKKKSK